MSDPVDPAARGAVDATTRRARAESLQFLSTAGATRPDRWRAAAFAVVSALVFGLAIPFATQPLGQFPAFVPIYVTALIICDLITATLLLSQYWALGHRSILILAAGYLFTAAVTIAYMLIFPGLIAPNGLFGAGPQTSSAMFMFWHAGFPGCVIVYAFAKGEALRQPQGAPPTRRHPVIAILITSGIVAAVVVAFTALATAGSGFLPEFLVNNHTTPLGHGFLAGIWFFNLAALVVLILRRPHTTLDLWLLVVVMVWLFDLALSAILNSGRYDLGWYVGRIYAVLASSFLLVTLLFENGRHYERLFRLSLELERANAALRELSSRDGLTGLANRHAFDEHLAKQTAVARRHGRPLALVICDVDRFKAYNDHFGHQAGDACLQRIAAVLRSCCRRPADLAARYGGEEFALVLPDTDAAAVATIAEEARRGVEALAIPHSPAAALAVVTVSLGTTTTRLGQAPADVVQLIAAADAALYRAKDQGRNRVVPG